MQNQIKTFYSKDWSFDSAQDKSYQLLDTGEGEKLERFGPYTFVRPYEEAVWPKCSTPSVQQKWAKADGKFWSSKVGAKAGWKLNKEVAKKWEMTYKSIKFLSSPTPFRHLGFFPEQASHWDFIEHTISAEVRLPQKPKIKFLNLFGYSGVASLFALRAGAEVTHVDASEASIAWAKENQKLNSHLGLEKMPMRIICDDALKFLEREVKRGQKYDAVIMDPPKFGRGPKGETWKIENDLPKLLALVQKVLSDQPLFVILNSYAVDSSSLSLGYALEDALKSLGGKVTCGELCLLEKSNNRTIPLSNTAIWSVSPL